MKARAVNPNRNDKANMEYSENPWAEDRSGEVLAGRYKLIRRIGRGGMGSVYLGIHQAIQKKVAIKLLDGQLVGQADFASRFVREAQSASRLRHGNIVDVTDFGETGDGSVFLVMEYLEGEDLGATLEREHRLPWPRVKHIVLQVLRALHCAHEGGILHRDIKLENCFRIQNLSDHDFIKVLDFGNAKEIASHPDVGVDVHLKRGRLQTAVGVIVGTAAYISPEQAQQLPLDARSDLYSVGVMIFELLTGRLPFEAATFMGVLNKHINDWPPTLREFAPDVEISAQVESLVAKLLAKTPDERYASAAKVALAIQAIPDGTPVVGPEIWFAPPRNKGSVDTRTMQYSAGQDNATTGIDGQSSTKLGAYPNEGASNRGEQDRATSGDSSYVSADQNQDLEARSHLRKRMDALASTVVLTNRQPGTDHGGGSADQLLRDQAESIATRGMESTNVTGLSSFESGMGHSVGDDRGLLSKFDGSSHFSATDEQIDADLGGTSPLNTISRSSSRLSSRFITRSASKSGGQSRYSSNSRDFVGVSGLDADVEFSSGWWSSMIAGIRRLLGGKITIPVEESPQFQAAPSETEIIAPNSFESSESVADHSKRERIAAEFDSNLKSDNGSISGSGFASRPVRSEVGDADAGQPAFKTTAKLDYKAKVPEVLAPEGSVPVARTEHRDEDAKSTNDMCSQSERHLLDDSGFIWEGVASRAPGLHQKPNVVAPESESSETGAEGDVSAVENSGESFDSKIDHVIESQEAEQPSETASEEESERNPDKNTQSLIPVELASANLEDTQLIVPPSEDPAALDAQLDDKSPDVYSSRRVEDEWDEILDQSLPVPTDGATVKISTDSKSASVTGAKEIEDETSAAKSNETAETNAVANETDDDAEIAPEPSDKVQLKPEEASIETLGQKNSEDDQNEVLARESTDDESVAKESVSESDESVSQEANGENGEVSEKHSSDVFSDGECSDEVGIESDYKKRYPKYAASSMALNATTVEVDAHNKYDDVSGGLQKRGHGLRNFAVASGVAAAIVVAFFGIGSGLQVSESSKDGDKSEKVFASNSSRTSSSLNDPMGKQSSKLLELRSRPDLDDPKASSANMQIAQGAIRPDLTKPSLASSVDSGLKNVASNESDKTTFNVAKSELPVVSPQQNNEVKNSTISTRTEKGGVGLPRRSSLPENTPSRAQGLRSRASQDGKNRRKRSLQASSTDSQAKTSSARSDRGKDVKVRLSAAMNQAIQGCGRKFGGFPGDRIVLEIDVESSGMLSRVRARGKRVSNDLSACIESKLSGRKTKSSGTGKVRQFVRL